MKLQFKHQQFQLDAVSAITDIFQGQGKQDGLQYLADPGRGIHELDLVLDAFRNHAISLSPDELRQQVNHIQDKYFLQRSDKLQTDLISGVPSYNFTIEMETGTGKTYTYIRTIMELNRRYGWLKFIIVVPSVAIREGVLKSFEVTAEHFQTEYGKQARFFVYQSSRLGDLDSFANSTDIQVMVINSQAFNAKGKDARRIHMEQESFRWRKPIDVIAATRPIMIIDEPQSVEGKKTKESLQDFKPLFTLRYSATHKEKYDMVYRLDAMDAYNKKLVKKIAVKAIDQSGTRGTDGYLYLQELIPQKSGSPKARIEFEVLGKTGIRRQTKIVSEGFNLYPESGELEAYRDGWTLSDFDARDDSIRVGANKKLYVGEIIGDVNELDMRRIQIRETIKSHFDKESRLYDKGIKVLSLFFIDEVAKYKVYDEQNQAMSGEYAQIFEEEYQAIFREYLEKSKGNRYHAYLEKVADAKRVHAGYFSVDKNKKTGATKFIDSKIKNKENGSDDQDAYDLIMKDKERLLSFEEPIRFLFSHSALKEGWDNPNVFQICTLKHSGTEIRKRQEIGRGMRLAVDQNGIRQDEELLGTQVHDINKLTVIANESYEQFAASLQNELKEVLSDRPVKIDTKFFIGRKLHNEDGKELKISEEIATEIYFDLVKKDYIDKSGRLTQVYYDAKESASIELPEILKDYENDLIEVINRASYNYHIENENETEITFSDHVNKENLAKQEFLSLWNKINHKSTYQVNFDDDELIEKSVLAINDRLQVRKMHYQITQGSASSMTNEGLDFVIDDDGKKQEYIAKPHISVRYDLLGEIADRTNLTRKMVAKILSQIYVYKFDFFKENPEDFIIKVSRIIDEEKAGQIIKHIEYHVLDEIYDQQVFFDNTETAKLTSSSVLPTRKGIYDYVKVDSTTEAKFKNELEAHEEVQVYVKLPGAFKIPTPVGSYNPDWAVAFKEGSVKHIYFVAETKGSMSSMQLKGAEKAKIDCAKAHFKALQKAGILEDQAIYDVVSSYEELLNIVRG